MAIDSKWMWNCQGLFKARHFLNIFHGAKPDTTMVPVDKNDVLERLTNLTLLLLEANRPLTITEICQSIPGYKGGPDVVSVRRQFERDKNTLRAEGIPIKVVSIDNGSQLGYRILKSEYYLPDLNLTEDEKRVLAIAASEVHIDNFSSLNPLRKLGVTGQLDTQSELPVSSTLSSHPELPVLFRAITNRNMVSFSYKGRDRLVGGYGLVSRKGLWYLVGFDTSHGEVRTFRVDRIEGQALEEEGSTYEIPDNFQVGAELPNFDWEIGESKPIMAKVRFDCEVAELVTALVGSDKVVSHNSDGSKIVEISVVGSQSFRSWILSYGSHAEIVDPPELREDLIKWLGQICEYNEQYRKSDN